MSKHIDFGALSKSDVAYIEQRPWLKEEFERQTGELFVDLLKEQGLEGALTVPTTTDEAEINRRIEERARELAAEMAANVQQAGDGEQGGNAGSSDSDEDEDVDTEDNAEREGADDGEGGVVPSYDEWEYQDLLAEVSSRNEQIEDEADHIRPESRSTENVIAALRADDKAHAE